MGDCDGVADAKVPAYDPHSARLTFRLLDARCNDYEDTELGDVPKTLIEWRAIIDKFIGEALKMVSCFRVLGRAPS